VLEFIGNMKIWGNLENLAVGSSRFLSQLEKSQIGDSVERKGENISSHKSFVCNL